MVTGWLTAPAELSTVIAAEKKSPWRERKEGYLAALARKDRGAQIVSACDKLHNLQNIVADMRAEGPGFLDRFNAKPEDLLWYYRGIRAALRADLPAPLLGELDPFGARDVAQPFEVDALR